MNQRILREPNKLIWVANALRLLVAHSKDCSFPVTDLKVKAPFFWFVEAYFRIVQKVISMSLT